MKEATGELNMTVITVVAIAALAAFFYLVIWPIIQNGAAINSACNASNGGNSSYTTTVNGKKVTCGNGKCTYNGTTKQCEETSKSNTNLTTT